MLRFNSRNVDCISVGNCCIDWLARIDLSPQNVVAIGDSGNDAEMLKMARYSFAMGNAAENIKQIARYATDDNNHEGALNVIQAVLDNTSPFNS